MSQTDSYARIPTARVKALCEATLQHIEDHKQQRRKQQIEKLVTEDKNSWWRKLLRHPVITFEEAKRHYWAEWKASGALDFHPEEVIRMYAWGSKRAAQRLLKLAQMTNSEDMMISARDLEYIE